MKIEGSTILVAGGSSGLGAACVSRLEQQRAKVLIADLNPPPETPRDSVVYCRTDVTDEQSVINALQSANERLGNLRAAVVCAGIIHGERIAGREGPGSLEAFRRVIEVNLVGTFNVLRLAASVLQLNEPDDQGERGVIVLTSSISAFEGQVGQAAYSASKGGVAALTLPAARELARFGIRVVTIAPGVFETPMMEQVNEKSYEVLQAQTLFPNRFGRPEEYAAMVIQIFENMMLNGTIVRLDGGMRMFAK